ncbi:GntR family transcriptional regulator [Pseudomonas sp. NFX224]|uniref:GntR family transcriptional regulator n=1 Tax=Pseudomonas sp. NFX224 TaxID=3402862 RepID=UPI003AFB74EE
MNSFASPQTLSSQPLARKHFAKPSVDDLYSRIFDTILEQRLLPGSRFTEDSLGRIFGVSRSSVHQVLIRLSQQQVVILRPNHRPQIAAPAPEQTRQILHARRLTETTLVQLACQPHRLGQLKTLRKLIELQRQCLESEHRGASIRLSGEFHLQLASMAGNAPLAHFLSRLVPLTSLAIAQCGEGKQENCNECQHAAIVDALEKTDVNAAVLLMTQHLNDLEQRLLRAHP